MKVVLPPSRHGGLLTGYLSARQNHGRQMSDELKPSQTFGKPESPLKPRRLISARTDRTHSIDAGHSSATKTLLARERKVSTHSEDGVVPPRFEQLYRLGL